MRISKNTLISASCKYVAVVLTLLLIGVINFTYGNLGQLGNLSFMQVLVYLVPGIPVTAGWLYAIYKFATYTPSKE